MKKRAKLTIIYLFDKKGAHINNSDMTDLEKQG